MINSFIQKALSGRGDSDSHLITLYSLVISCKAKNVLELGVRKGDSTLPLLAAVKHTNGFLNSVDTIDSGYRPPQDLSNYWKLHVVNSIDYLKSVDKKLDLVFIDDWHDGNHIYEEIKLIEPWTTKETLILLHDTMHTFRNPDYNNDLGDYYFGHHGPYGAICRLDKSKWEYSTIPFNHGLTILRKYI